LGFVIGNSFVIRISSFVIFPNISFAAKSPACYHVPPGMVLNMEENPRIAREMCELGLWKEVLAFAQQWHMEAPSDYMALYYIGLGYTGLRQFRKAEAAYRRALAIEPSAARVWNNLAGLLYEFMNCQSEGIRCMEQSLKLDPDHKLGWANLATMVGRLGHHEQAIAYADRAIALDSDFVEAHLHKGRAALAMGKMEIVKEVCQKLASIRPEKFRRAH
jgi:tetratricopeptide (TPR) repeat protein